MSNDAASTQAGEPLAVQIAELIKVARERGFDDAARALDTRFDETLRPPVPVKLDAPTFDRDGYPTDETLTAIRFWPHTDFAALCEFARAAWHYPDYITMKDGVLTAATGGWSGNESVISALRQNRVFWGLCWRESVRGGRHVFELPESMRKPPVAGGPPAAVVK